MTRRQQRYNSSDAADKRRIAGFTLLEVMIALAILSVASAGLVSATGGYLRQTQKIEDKVLAAWVADNWLNELRLTERAPDVGMLKAEASMADRQWDLQADVIQTNSPLLYRLEIEVRRQEDPEAVLIHLTAFLRAE
ncbi:type II secretion system minor pseudopilin GspI [Oceanospirillum sediminis]|uniref:Type II secretion system protein I n=1 Tax=Oceanospirillum sediminis TaxID=2760088 RepID=A0A839IKX1_9GAMM|nr:type II secretion system minor pseudopilin GspI [Oceanospirillum sediminis]MBB1485855.1 type II secretion system minor pseudopilin GspI [Oceanospirillum sediminis]